MNKWKTVKLSDICILEKGQQIDTSLLDDSKPYRYINGGIKESGYFDNFNTSGESVLISEGGASCGYINYVNENFWCGCHCYRLHDIKVFPKYLFHALKANQQRIMALRTGSAMPNIQKSTIQKFELKIHDDSTSQKKVATILDKCNELIEKHKQTLEKYDMLIKSRFIEMFGDPVTNPKKWKTIELGKLTSIGSSKRIFEKEYVSSGIPFYRTKEIVELSKGNPITTELYISEERYKEIKEKFDIPQKDDLLISAVGTIGIIWIVDGKQEFYFKDGNLIKINASESFNSKYMKLLLESLISEHKKKMSTGTAYSALTISGLSKMKIYIPPLTLQNTFAAFVQQIDKSKFESNYKELAA